MPIYLQIYFNFTFKNTNGCKQHNHTLAWQDGHALISTKSEMEEEETPSTLEEDI
jgi:hypothetical protein